MIVHPLVSVLYVSCRLSIGFGPRLAHLKEWFHSWVPDSVFSAGKGVSSVGAWYATSVDIEEVHSHTRHNDFHIFNADVVKSFDTVDRDILDCALGRLGLPAFFRRVCFSFHREVRLRFKLAAGLGAAWTRDGGILQGCPLRMVFIVALYAPWCRHLESLVDISPNSMLIISIAPPVTSTLYWLLPNILYPVFMPWDRRPLLVSACYSAPPRLLADA